MKFEHQISEGTLSDIGPQTEGLDCFYCTTLNFERKLPTTALCADRCPLKRETTRHVIDFDQWEHAKN